MYVLYQYPFEVSATDRRHTYLMLSTLLSCSVTCNLDPCSSKFQRMSTHVDTALGRWGIGKEEEGEGEGHAVKHMKLARLLVV